MPVPPPSPTKERSELEQIQIKTDQVTNASLSSTRKMRALCEEAKDAATRSLVALDDQGEKLENIERGMLSVDKDMKDAEKNMRGLGKGMFSFMSFPFKKSNKSSAKVKEDPTAASGGGPRPGIASDAGIPTYGGFISKYTNDSRETEMEENLEEVSNMVGNLRHIALDLGNELTNQNAQIDRISNTGEVNIGRISTANEKAHNLLK